MVYIDDEHIVKDSTCTKAFYDKEEIRTRNPKTIIKRNDDKRRMLDMLSTTKQVLNIDYLCLYFSCNLEHVLQGNANILDDDKMSLAKAFKTEYYEKEDAFIKFICDSSFSVQLPYEDSWKYIKEENHSIERKTNFTCLFKAIESDN